MLRGYSPLRGSSSYDHTRDSPEDTSALLRKNSYSPGGSSAHPIAWDLKVVAWTHRVLSEASDWKMIAPMLLASPAYQVGKIAAFRFLLSTPGKNILGNALATYALPKIAGLGLETTFFSLSSRSLTHLFHAPVAWDAASVARDWAGAGMTLGFLKIAGHVGRHAAMEWRGLAGKPPTAWSAADHRALWWSSQASAYLGLVGSHELEKRVGLRLSEPGGNLWLDALGTHIALGLGSHGGRRLLGDRLTLLEQQLAAQVHALSQKAGASSAPTNPDIFDLRTGLLPAAVGNAGAMLTLGTRPKWEINQVYSQGSDPAAQVYSSIPPSLEGSRNGTALKGKYVVIGNRGEPAVRAIHTVKEMGGQPIVYVSDADRESLHATLDGVIPLRLKGRTSKETYTNVEARMDALKGVMKSMKIDAKDMIAWEGWGFLSEDAELFARYEEMGIGIAGAPSRSHRLMGDKVSARRIAKEMGVPVVEGSEEINNAEEGLRVARIISFPVMAKGRTTGGGSAVIPIFNEKEFHNKFEATVRQAENTSGNPSIFIEKYIPSLRHLEVQIIADGQGNFVILGERDCTIQRKSKKQKIVEEEVTNFLREEIREQAVGIAKKIMSHPEMKFYKGPGTIEIIWNTQNDQLTFMEMNTRLQVEHTVSEMVTGKNLLKAQLELGAGLPLSFSEARAKGHSIEVRVTAEDPFDQFKASTGRILYYREPQAHKTERIRVRVDSGIEAGSVVTADYDPMLAKLIVWGATRQDALEGLRNALDQFVILGVTTNIPFLKKLIASEEFQKGEVPDTNWVEDVFLKSEGGKPDYTQLPTALVTASIQTFLQRKEELQSSKSKKLSGTSVNSQVNFSFQGQAFQAEVYEQPNNHFLVKIGDEAAVVSLNRSGDFLYLNRKEQGIQRRVLVNSGLGKREVLLDNMIYKFKVEGEGELGAGAILSPMAGKVVKISVQVGQVVKKGDTLLIVEAMKMENAIAAPKDGVVEEIKIAEDKQVEEGAMVVKLKVSEGQAAADTPQEATGVQLIENLGLGSTFLQSVKSKKANELSAGERTQIMEQFKNYFEGYDAPSQDLMEILPLLRLPNGLGETTPEAAAQREFIGGLIRKYLEIESIFMPSNWSHWVRFRQMGIFTDEKFQTQIGKLIKERGLTLEAPGTELEDLIYRLTQSHNHRREKAWILAHLMPWVAEDQMVELAPLLPSLARIYVDGVPRSFSNWVTEHQLKLRKKISQAQEVSSLERAFELALQPQRGSEKQAIQELFSNTEVLPFLVRQISKQESPSDKLTSKMTGRLLQEYFYESHYSSDRDKYTPVGGGQIIDLKPHPDVRAKGLQVYFGVVEGELTPAAFENYITEVMKAWPLASFDGKHRPVKAIEILLSQGNKEGDLLPYQEILDKVVVDPSIERVTLIGNQDSKRVVFTTLEKSAEKKWKEVKYLRGIHPMMAEDLGLSRWKPNFEINPQEHILPDAANVMAFGLHAKADKNDNRNLVIGEHRGRISLDRFQGERVENRLINDYQHLLKNPRYEMEADSKIVWSWLPYALKEKGMVPEGLDPLSFGVLAATPAELIKRFEITEATLKQVASFYDGKVKSVPQVERMASDTALAVDQIQDPKSPTVADLFIRQPVEMSNAEITLLAFRLAPMFVGKNLEKTTVHFKRWEDGILRGYIAEIKIPGKTRFEVNIKPALEDVPPHRVRTALERKRLKQQGRGRLYVYDQVQLIQDIVKEDFFPKGNSPTEAVHVQEMDLKNGALVPVQREVGENKTSKVAFEVTVQLPIDPSGADTVTRTFMVIADDYTVKNGAMGRREGALYKAAADRAVEKGIPLLYLDESVGAFIGFAHELMPYLHHDTEKNIIYVNASDLEQVIPKTDLKVIDIIDISEPYGEGRFPVTSILGIGDINTESLNGSGMAGAAMSRARKNVPTATIVSGTSVGIATYLARLSEFVIMLKDAFLGLTGRNAINNTFGTTYKTEKEIAGADVMADSGVAYKIAENDRKALQAFIKWIHYLPVKMGEQAPQFRLGPKDSITDRDLEAAAAKYIKGRGQMYPTKEIDRALFDPESIYYVQDDGYWGRRINVGYARLGGTPVAIASMEMSPKPFPGENEKMLYAGGLDGHSSLKLSDHIKTANRFGLPLIFNGSITGFLPRKEDHLIERVIPGGATILDFLQEFNQAAIIWIPPQGFLYGGAWAVVDRNVNPNVVMVADHTAQLGILGSAAANELPFVTDHHRTPADKKKTRLMLDLQNTPQRARKVDSIHRVIEDTGATRAVLYDLLQNKTVQIKAEREAERERQDLLRQVTGTLDIMGWGYALLPEGKIEMRLPEATLVTGLDKAKSSLQMYLINSQPLDILRSVITKSEGDGFPPKKGEEEE